MDNRQDFKNINTDELVAKVQGLRLATALGADYQLCKKAAEPLLEEINLRVAKIAKRFNQKPRLCRHSAFTASNIADTYCRNGKNRQIF